MSQKRLLIIIALCCLSFTQLMAQARYCMSYADYQDDKWVELDTLQVKTRRSGIRLRTGNDALDEKLKKEAFAVLYHDTLMVNCEHMYYRGECFGNGYVLAHSYGNGEICFVNGIPGNENNVAVVPVVAGAGAIGGVIAGVAAGAAISVSSRIGSRDGWCYLVKREYEGGRIEARRIDDEYMKRYKKVSPEFYAEYMSVKKKAKRESASHIIPLMREWSLLY